MAERDPAGLTPPPAAAAPSDRALARLEAHLDTLDATGLLRIARAVEMARACEPGDPTDDQILNALRPRLQALRADRLPTFQRAICTCLEPFLREIADPGVARRQASVARGSLARWWRLLRESRHRFQLDSLESEYGLALKEGKSRDVVRAIDRGVLTAAEATAGLLADAQSVPLRRAALQRHMGGEAGMADLQEIAALLAAHPQLTPALERVRRAAGVDQGRIAEFTPPILAAARTAYLNLHDPSGTLAAYFFFGLMGQLAQPWQALRLVRLLSQDLSKIGDSPARLIPARLFSDLTSTLADIGRLSAPDQSMPRRLWLLTSARLLGDAGVMIRGLAEEGDAEQRTLLNDARACVARALDGFAAASLRDCLLMLPVREVQGGGGKPRLEPDMSHSPSEEEIGTAQAAATLFAAVRRLAEQENLQRGLRAKEADLEEGLRIGVNFRIEFLRARLKHGIAVTQLEGVLQVLRLLPALTIIRDLEYRVQRTLDRFR